MVSCIENHHQCDRIDDDDEMVGHVTRVGEMEKSFTRLAGQREGKRLFGRFFYT